MNIVLILSNIGNTSKHSPNNPIYELTAWIGIHQRIVEAISIPVIILCKIRSLHKIIRTYKNTKGRIVHTTIHVNKAQFIQMLVAGKTSCKEQPLGCDKFYPSNRVTAIAPGIIAQALFYVVVGIGYAT